MRPLMLPAAGLLLLACASGTPEGRVREAFRACVRGVEEGKAEAVIERLSPRFQGPDGMDAAAAKLYLMGVLRQEKVGVTVLSDQIEVKGSVANQTVDLLLTGRGEGLLPQEASRRTFALRWEKKGSEWRLRELTQLQGGAT